MRLELSNHALEDLQYWVKTDVRKARKILKLIDETQRDPFKGTGKPEALKHALEKCWSRRIDQEHRLVYLVENDALVILACRYHY